MDKAIPIGLGVGATALSGGTLAPLFGSSLLSQGLLGAGVGALGSALTGSNPLQGALLGAGGGALSGAMGLGGATSGIGGSVSKVPSSMGINLAPAVVGDTSLSLAPQAVNAGGMFATNSLPTAAAELGTSGVGGISNLAQYATGAGTDIMAATPSLLDKLKPYANVQNLSGAMNIADKFKPKPPQFNTAQTGGVSRGQAPQQNGLIMSMDELMKLSQLQQRKPISLLVG
jgi:hypothetical protein